MTPQIEHLKELFEQALSQPSGERHAFVRDACSGDKDMEIELSSLLDAHDSSSGFFEKLAAELIAPALSAVELDDRDDAAGADKTVLHYDLVERIGGGGMGIVYKARDTRLGRTVALKFLPRGLASNPAARARLLAEARSASSLDHPNIGTVYEIAETADARQFIAMAWYDGETLKEKIRRGPIPSREVVRIVSQLGSALAAAHSAGIVHRDVKPANVIITSNGSVKLLDFGIAKLMSADDGDAHPAGTIAYMSPEQTRGGAMDARTDIWSVGVLMYEMLIGARPFRRETDEQVIAAIRDEEPPSLLESAPGLSPSLAKIVERCIEKDPARRFQSAHEFLAALDGWDRTSGDPISSGSDARARESSDSSRNRRRIPIAAAALLVIAVTLLAYKKYTPGGPPGPSAIAARPVSVAVLSFADSMNEDTSQYLSVAMPDEIRTELSRFRTLTVPSYLSSYGFRPSQPIPEVARETGGRYIVTSSLSRDAQRMTIELFDGKTGASLWRRGFDTTSPERTRIVNEAVGNILSSMQLALTRDDKERLAASPTVSPRAYDLYLRARSAELIAIPHRAFMPPSNGGMREAQALYAQAKVLDPDFARARARLALSHMYSATTYDTTAARIDQARVEAETALRLDSSMFEAHDALSQVWGRLGDQQRSFDELNVALRAAPANTGLLLALGTRLVFAGRWDEGIAKLERVTELDPRNPRASFVAGTLYGRKRDNEKAMAAFNRLLRVWPDDYLIRIIKGHCFLRWTGSTDTLVAELRKVPPEWDEHGMASYGWYTAYRTERKYREGLAMLDRTPTRLSWDEQIYHPHSLMRAEYYDALGESRLARINYDSTRAMLADSVAAHPDQARIHIYLGLAYAGLGKKRQALEEADAARALVPVSKNSVVSTAYMGVSVEIFGQVGELDRAFETIELMLSMPAGREMTVAFLRVWPGFDPLRGDPRFAQVLARYTPN